MPHPISLRKLRAFYAVMTSATATEAGNRLHLTQPAVSRLISTLQEELGLVLFSHRAGRLEPTPEGREFFRETERYLAGLDDIRRIAEDIRMRNGRRVRVIATAHVANWFLPRVLNRFAALSGDTVISLEVGTRKEIERWIAGLQFDIGFVVLPADHPSVVSTPFANVGMGALMPAWHRLAAHSSLSASDLVNENLVVLQSSSLLRQCVDRAFRRLGETPRIRIETATTLIACQFAQSRVAVVDRLTARSVAVPDTVFRPLDRDPEFDLDYGYILPANGESSHAIQSIVSLVRDEAARQLSRAVETETARATQRVPDPAHS